MGCLPRLIEPHLPRFVIRVFHLLNGLPYLLISMYSELSGFEVPGARLSHQLYCCKHSWISKWFPYSWIWWKTLLSIHDYCTGSLKEKWATSLLERVMSCGKLVHTNPIWKTSEKNFTVFGKSDLVNCNCRLLKSPWTIWLMIIHQQQGWENSLLCVLLMWLEHEREPNTSQHVTKIPYRMEGLMLFICKGLRSAPNQGVSLTVMATGDGILIGCNWNCSWDSVNIGKCISRHQVG
jgi:hypothetical protein